MIINLFRSRIFSFWCEPKNMKKKKLIQDFFRPNGYLLKFKFKFKFKFKTRINTWGVGGTRLRSISVSCGNYSKLFNLTEYYLYIHIYIFFFFHHTTCESTCDTLASSAAIQGDNTVSVAQGGTTTPGATEQLLPPDRVFKRYIYLCMHKIN